MNKNLFLLTLGSISLVNSYYTIIAHSSSHPEIHGQIINAHDRAFVIGAKAPTTSCDLENRGDCPAGSSTLINAEMTKLASAVPGGQFIYVSSDGSISYPSAHSALRPPGSQMGGFYSTQTLSDCEIPVNLLSWQSDDGSEGLWACPASSLARISESSVLKASVAQFNGDGCIEMDGIQIQDAGGEFGAWAYT